MIQGSCAQMAELLHLELNGEDTDFLGISIDSRSIQKNNLFIALKGETFDGHDYIDKAIASGAAAVITERPLSFKIPYILCEDSRALLGEIAHWWRQKFSIPVLALTGTCGKTTTKEMLRNILSVKHNVLAPEKTFNNDIGVPLTLFKLGAEHEFVVLEAGTNHPGEIKALTEIIMPDIAAITNIGSGHIAAFHTTDAIAKEKSDIYRNLVPEGIAIINADDRYCPYFQDVLHQHKTLICGVHAKKADVKAADLACDALQRPHFRLLYQEKSISIKLPVLGRHQVMNALIAATMALAVGISLNEIKEGLETPPRTAQRMQLYQLLSGGKLIDDTYNAIPEAVISALQEFAYFPQKRFFVFGGMAELGEKSISYHQEIGALAKSLKIDKLFAVGEYSNFTVESFGENGFYFSDKKALIDSLTKEITAKTNILVKGSRSSSMEEVVQALIRGSK